VGAVERPGRVEAARKEGRGLLAIQRLQCDLRTAQQLDCLRCEAGERDLGEVGLSFARAEHEHDPPPPKRRCLAERVEEAGVIERRLVQAGCALGGCVRDLIRVLSQACLFALDVDLDSVGERVQEPCEDGDEGGLLVGAAQFEACSLSVEQPAVATAGELDEPVCEHAPDRNVERRESRLARASR
jgi:hypothetical protein